jgi:hypothetical protein
LTSSPTWAGRQAGAGAPDSSSRSYSAGVDLSGQGAHERHGAEAPPAAHAEHAPGDRAQARGLATAEGGLRFEAEPTIVGAGEKVDFAFTIVGPDGHPVTSFEELHERRMHLIVVRRDLTGFQHLHPDMFDDGTWRTNLVFPTGGAWRAFADFATGGVPSTLGLDVLVEGDFRPEPLPAPTTTADVAGDVVSVVAADGGSHLRFTVTREGRRVAVEPYLGAGGHLVVLRWGDLAFLHVHPMSEEEIAFEVNYPALGTYRLFLQYSVGGVVRTAAFTIVAS